MTRWLCMLAFACLPMIALSAPVAVTSGEHAGFTRIVLDFGKPVDWKLGRTSSGYELRLEQESIGYDLSAVFDLIRKDRLAAIWADPETGALQIGVACACHAIPFEFRPGIVVIDLKDGAPPAGSSFEQTLLGTQTSVLAARATPRPRSRPNSEAVPAYDWTAAALLTYRKSGTVQSPVSNRSDIPEGAVIDRLDPDTQVLRDTLLRQLSRGAAQGVVDLVMPQKETTPSNGKTFPGAQVRIGELTGLTEETGPPEHGDLAADGRACIGAELLDLAAWGTDLPVSAQMADAMTGLVGEFDRPDSDILKRAVQFNLYLGFGAEARQLLRAFPSELPETAIWRSLAYLLDDEPDPAPVFEGLGACDTPSALWAVLTDPAPTNGAPLNTAATLRAFSALPVHLRRHLGLRLADRFLALDDTETARAIRDAILRAPGASGSEVALLQVSMDLKSGDPLAAEAKLREILADPAQNAGEALIALVEARTAPLLPVDADLVGALEAMISEQSGQSAEPRYRRALALAQAASGNFDAAFASLDRSDETVPDIWRLLGAIGQDDVLLTHAILPEETSVPATDEGTAIQLANRLLNLGFPDQALRWVSPGVSVDPVLLAQAALQRQDPAAALGALQDREDVDALVLRAQAYRMLGDESSAAKAYSQAGDPEAMWQSVSRAGDWRKLSQDGPDLWQAAAEKVPVTLIGDVKPPESGLGSAIPVIADGPISRGYALAENSAQTREAVALLLASIPNSQSFLP